MNCKQGDMAIVIGSQYNNGKMVTCLHFVGKPPFIADGGDWWEVDRPLEFRNAITGAYTGTRKYARDCQLMPIGKQGETLEIETEEVIAGQ